jgi:trimethylamine--corrinoid protein Co-methyltransferase
MLAYENCQSLEKLVLDAETIALIQQFSQGIHFRDEPLAAALIQEVGHSGNFISHDHTYQWFKDEVYYPSAVLDRQPAVNWEQAGGQDSWDRAGSAVNDLINQYQGPTLDDALQKELRSITSKAASAAGMDRLPDLPQ